MIFGTVENIVLDDKDSEKLYKIYVATTTGLTGNTIEAYEDSSIKNKDRSSDSFVNWIESKILEGKIVSDKPSSSHHVYKRIRKSHSKSKSHSDSKGKSRKTNKRKVVRKGKSRRIKK